MGAIDGLAERQEGPATRAFLRGASVGDRASSANVKSSDLAREAAR